MAKRGNGAARDPRETRLQVMLTRDELEALDDFRYRKRMPSRASAIREILRRGLAAEGFDLADKDSRSSQFGVMKDSSRSVDGPAE